MLINRMITQESHINISNFEPEGIILSILSFISINLPKFQIDSKEVDLKNIEKSYNSQLSMFLNVLCKDELYNFHHNPHRKNSREPDIGIPIETQVLEGNYDSIFDIECKRLNKKLSHKKQYVCGETGGIERFKRNLHGCDLSYSAIIGYLEDESIEFWTKEINSWIMELHTKENSFWTEKEFLQKTEYDYFKSKHLRFNSEILNSITLFHFFHFSN